LWIFREANRALRYTSTMSAHALIHDDPRDAQMALVMALVRVLSDRVTALEHRDVEDVDRTGWMTVPIAAYRSGYSESGIRKLVRQNRVAHEWIGRRVFVTSLPERR
jgi:hypothetical protein